MFGDFPGFLTLFVCQPPRGTNWRLRLSRYGLGTCYSLPSSALSMAISLPARPPFSPLYPGGPRAEGLEIGA